MRMGMMRIPCKNLSEAEVFYTEKIGLNKLYGNSTDGYIGYSLDNIEILLEHEEKGEFESGGFLGFSLVVEDLTDIYEKFSSRGVRFTGPPEKQQWGGIMTHIVDDSGNSFSLVQESENA